MESVASEQQGRIEELTDDQSRKDQGELSVHFGSILCDLFIAACSHRSITCVLFTATCSHVMKKKISSFDCLYLFGKKN
jgi:hypothetical protein